MRRLPNAELAVVEDGKLSGYIFNSDHKEGWPKGRFLILHGFDRADPARLREALLRHGRENDVADSEATAFGVKHRVDGPLPTPSARVVWVRTVWQIDAGQTTPRFVTLKPIGARS